MRQSSQMPTNSHESDSVSTFSPSPSENVDSAKNVSSGAASIATPDKSPRVKRSSTRLAHDNVLSRFRRMGWWWEWTAVVLSVTCTLLTVAVLARMDGKPMRAWPLAIQPTSLIAFLTNIGNMIQSLSLSLMLVSPTLSFRNMTWTSADTIFVLNSQICTSAGNC